MYIDYHHNSTCVNCQGRCGEGQFSEMNMVHTKLKEAKDVNIPYIYSVLDDHLASLSESSMYYTPRYVISPIGK